VRGLPAFGLAAVAAWAVWASATAAETAHEPKPPREDCTLAEAEKLNVARFAADPERYSGRCVHARGIIVHRGFVRNRRDLYERAAGEEASPMIAVYGAERDTTGTQQLWIARTYADVVAYAYSCDELVDYVFASAERANAEARANPGEGQVLRIPFIPGLCHYRRGPLLFVSQWTALPGMPTRLTDRGSARRYGNLEEVNARWPHYDEVKAAVLAWIDPVRVRDVSRVSTALAILPDRGPGDTERKWAAWLTDPAVSPLAFLIGMQQNPPIKIFLEPAGRNAEGYRAYACVCKTHDCEGQWPFHSIDAYPQLEDPYACFDIAEREGAAHVSTDLLQYFRD
jgi:hypothetical protein